MLSALSVTWQCHNAPICIEFTQLGFRSKPDQHFYFHKRNGFILTEFFFKCQLHRREVAAAQYNAKLQEKFQHHPQLKRIKRHRHVPRPIYQETKTIRVQRESIKRK